VVGSATAQKAAPLLVVAGGPTWLSFILVLAQEANAEVLSCFVFSVGCCFRHFFSQRTVGMAQMLMIESQPYTRG
jgi:cytochrome c oxidase assembly factor CtaG